MTEQAIIAALTEDSIKAALIEARGDIFVASQMLGVTATRMDRAIRVSTALQATQLKLIELSTDDKFAKASSEAVHTAVESRIAMYRVTGLDALYDLATMPIGENSAMAQVKLASAVRLAGPTESIGGGSDIAETLRALNEQYHAEAPRIRVVRERISIEVDGARDITPHPDRQAAE